MNQEMAERLKGQLEVVYEEELSKLRARLKEVLALFYIALGDAKEIRVPFKSVLDLEYSKCTIDIKKDHSKQEWIVTAGVISEEVVNEADKELADSP